MFQGVFELKLNIKRALEILTRYNFYAIFLWVSVVFSFYNMDLKSVNNYFQKEYFVLVA